MATMDNKPLLQGEDGDAIYESENPMLLLRTKAPGRKAGFDRIFCRRLKTVVRMGFGGWCTRMAWRAYGIWFLTLLAALVQFAVSLVLGPLITAIKARNAELTFLLVAGGGGVYGLVTLVMVYLEYLGEKLALDWRKNVVNKLHEKYLTRRKFYYLNSIDGRVDNADQRVTQDVAQVTILAGRLMFSNYQVLESVVFMILVGAASSAFVLTKVDWLPLMAGLGYAVVVALVSTALLVPVARMTYVVNEFEGYYRFLHARVKEFAEAITLYRGQPQEQELSSHVYSKLYWRFRWLFKRQFFVSTTNTFQLSNTVVFACLMIGVQMQRNGGTIAGKAPDIEQVQETVTALGRVIGSICSIIALYSTTGALVGLVQRVGQLSEALDELDGGLDRLKTQQHGSSAQPTVAITRAASNAGCDVVLRNLAVSTPAGQPLLRGVNLTIPAGTSVLIMGKSGSGKSSLLRVIAGLWPAVAGSVEKPSIIGSGGVFYVPQRPYITQGSLRQQIIYPHTEQQQFDDDAALCELLRSLDLGHLLVLENGLDAVVPWDSFLSGGEQQRLGFARLFYHRPAVAVMDESTSALNVELEARCMRGCHERGISCISVGHRPTLIQHHSMVMMVEDGSLRQVQDTSELAGMELPPASTGEGEEKDDDADMTKSTRMSQFDAAGTEGGMVATGAGHRASVVSVAPDVPKMMAGEKEDGAVEKMQFNAAFWRRLWLLVRIGFPSLFTKSTGVLIVAMLVSVATSISIVAMAALPGQLYQALTENSFDDLAKAVLLNVGARTAFAILQSYQRWLSQMVGLYWYMHLVQDAENMYMSGSILYGSNNLMPGLDNMDQRIASDCRQFTQQITQLFLGGGINLVETTSTIIVSTIVASRLGWLPLVGVYTYTSLCTLITLCLMRPIVPASYAKNQREGDFRFTSARIREFGESIAFYGGDEQEKQNADAKFAATYDAAMHLIWKQWPVTAFNNFNAFFGPVFGYLMIGILAIQTGQIGGQPLNQKNIVNSAQLLLILLGELSQMPRALEYMAPLAGFTHRVGHMFECLTTLDRMYTELDSAELFRAGDIIRADNITVKTPSGLTMFRNLSFSVPQGQNLLIMGPSGVGKTSLLRILCGLWPLESGCVSSPQFHSRAAGSRLPVFIVPQRPYVVMNGSLREQIQYPSVMQEHEAAGEAREERRDEAFSYDSKSYGRQEGMEVRVQTQRQSYNAARPDATDAQLATQAGDRELLKLVRALDLGHLLTYKDGLDSRASWEEILSVGEQQRLGFARLLHHRPVYALMDESTSALDVAMETKVMNLCQEAGITCISVGHRPTLRKFHSQVLHLEPDNSYSLEQR